MKITVVREQMSDEFTLGKMSVEGMFFGYTCERPDRKLEDGGTKIDGETAIPRGTYKVIVNFSPHFQRELTELVDVPHFSGVRIHGGNHADDSEGCILLGRVRTTDGCANCSERVQSITNLAQQKLDSGEEVWLTVS